MNSPFCSKGASDVDPTYVAWVLGGGCTVAAVATGVNFYRKAADEFDRARLALADFILTGKKTDALGSLPRSVIQAAERSRTRVITGRLLKSQQFSVYCYCPSCTFFAVHWIRKTDKIIQLLTRNTVVRECRECGFKWSQR